MIPLFCKINWVRWLLLFLFFSPAPSFPSDECYESRIWIYYGNGMFNTELDAAKSRKVLEIRLKAFLKDNHPSVLEKVSSVKLAYNTNEKISLQLLEVGMQKLSDLEANFFRYLGNLRLAPEWFRKKVLELALLNDQRQFVDDIDLQKQAINYSRHIRDREVLVIVSHSQGNLYANAAFEILKHEFEKEIPLKKYFGVVAVATPSNHVIGNRNRHTAPYTTLFSDNVITPIPGILPPNVKNSSSRVFDHYFIKSYLNGNSSGPKILENVAKVINSLQAQNIRSWEDSPGLFRTGYVHKSLIPFWEWLQNHANRPQENLSKARCLAISAFARIYDWWGEACSERSLKAISKWMTDCTSEWSDPNQVVFHDCPLHGLPSTTNIHSKPLLESILKMNPECRWPPNDIHKIVTESLIKEALTELATKTQ